MSIFSTMSHTELLAELTGLSPAAMAADMPAAYCAESATQAAGGSALARRRLAVARELLLRGLAAQLKSGPLLSSPRVVQEWLTLHYAGAEQERFLVLFLDVRHRLIEAEEMFRGTLTQTSVYPREVVKAALAHNAAAVIFAHNHPSGDAMPSQADRALTQQLKSALSLVDVQVADHFVVAGDAMLSFAEHGWI